MKRIFGRLLPAVLIAGVTLTAPQPAAADVQYPGCKDFNITFSASGGNQATRVVTLRDGVVYSVTGGHGTTLTFTNASSGKSVTFPTNGSVTRAAVSTTKGTTTYQLSGFNVLILFPTDPGGPSTILYTGRVTFTVETVSGDLVEPVTSSAGRQRDICAELG